MARESGPSQSREQKLVLTNFIAAARAKGAADEFIYQLLRRRGWSQQEVESAFAQVYESLTELPVPVPINRVSESSREAFLYLLSFTTLGIWSQALGQIGFITVDQLLPDPLNKTYGGQGYKVASSLARLIVVFPIYLFLMRLLIKDLASHPDKYQSGVRKWLTYLALLIAALVAIVDLIVFLTSLLQGELTTRFTYKVIIVLAIASGILWYHLDLAATTANQVMSTNFDRLFAPLAVSAVVIAVITGFWLLGSPQKQRQLRADQQRLQDMREIAQRLHEQAKRSPNRGKLFDLPASLPPPIRQSDPVSGKTYEYRRLDSTRYQLCAEFATDSNQDRLRNSSENQDFWQHPPGQHCFQLDVLELPYP